jgi:hypothetical protein
MLWRMSAAGLSGLEQAHPVGLAVRPLNVACRFTPAVHPVGPATGTEAG